MASAMVMNCGSTYDPLRDNDPGCGKDYVSSYWAATANPVPDDDGPLRGDAEADIVIIGGGYTGLSCAFHLAQNHGIAATVIEANRPGWGCSGRNGGSVHPTLSVSYPTSGSSAIGGWRRRVVFLARPRRTWRPLVV
jgi:hypothetical protein